MTGSSLSANSGWIALAQVVSDLILITDADGVIEYANRGFGGRPASELTAQSWLDWLDEDDQRRVRAAMITLARGKRPDPCEVDWPSARGESRRVSCVLRTAPENSGRVLVVVTDVTERRRSAEALRKSEERYRAIVENQTELICRFTPDGVLTYANPAYAHYFGGSPEDLVGQSVYPLMTPVNRDKLKRLLTRLTPEQPTQYLELRVEDDDGSVRARQWIDRGIFDEEGRLVEVLAVGRDITAMKEIEGALRESEERLRFVLDNTPAIILTLHPDGTILYVNRVVEGLDPNEVVGEDSMKFTHPEDIEIARGALRQVVDEGKTVDYEVRGYGVGGTVAWYSSRLSPVIRHGRVEAAMLITMDISDRRRTERELQTTQELNRQIIETMPGGMVRVRADGAIVEANAEAQRFLGLSFDQLRARYVEDFEAETIDEDGRPLPASAYPAVKCLESRQREGPLTIGVRRPDGSIGWAVFTAVPLIDSESDAVTDAIVTFLDISARKAAEEAIRRSERRLRRMVERLPAGAVYVDDVEIFCNQTIEEITGYSRKELTTLDEWFRVLFGVEGRSIRKRYELDREEGFVHRRTWMITRGDGAKRYLEFAGYRDEESEVWLVDDITDRQRALARQTLLMLELDHRVKNNLSAVLSLADQTIATSESLDDFRQAFMGRIGAMARSHEVLASHRWEGVEPTEVVRLVLSPLIEQHPDQLRLHGQDLMLPARTALPVSLALHELATNAVKYGGLSTPSGRVDLSWRLATDESRIVLRWEESGGPAVAPPSRRGSGARLIEGLIEFELGGRARFEYQPGGLVCELRVPLDPD
ncbi:MAG: PAS domain S-box protein [Phycisphaerales bacterium]